MFVGVCHLTVRLPENASLKGKRQVVLSLSQRLRNKFNVAVAEVGDAERWQIAELGVSCVSNEAGHAREQLENVVRFVEETRPDAELIGSEIEVVDATS
jgi:uncharacterized protein YlxP (DUF503 family)